MTGRRADDRNRPVPIAGSSPPDLPPSLVLGERRDDVPAEMPAPEADPRAVIEELRRRLRTEQERALNATDAMVGARAEAAQARAEVRELYHRLHVREAELRALEALLPSADDTVGSSSSSTGGVSGARPGSGADEPPTVVARLGRGLTVDGRPPSSPAEAVEVARTVAGSVARRLGLR